MSDSKPTTATTTAAAAAPAAATAAATSPAPPAAAATTPGPWAPPAAAAAASTAPSTSSSSSSSSSSPAPAAASASPAAASASPQPPANNEPDSPPGLEEYDNDTAEANKSKTGSSYYFFKSTPASEAAKYAPTPIPAPTTTAAATATTTTAASSSSSSSPSPAPTLVAANSGLSAWNAAGTWEEKDMSSWACDRVRALLLGVSGSASGVTASITTVTKAEGDASIVFTRGKKRPGYDLHITAEWSGNNKEGQACEGTVEIAEFETSLDIDDDVKIKYTLKKGSDGVLKAMKAGEKKIREQLARFAKELQDQC